MSVNLVNEWEKRIAYKIKSSNNESYRVSASHGFIEPGTTLPIEITRLVRSLFFFLCPIPVHNPSGV